MDILINIVAFVLVLCAVISVHEFGHLIVAKLFGMRVLTFSIGFGRRLVGIRIGETDYRLSLIPLGGYVDLSGEIPKDDPEDTQDEEDELEESRKFINKPRWQRILVLFAGPAMNGILTVVILSALLMTSGQARATHFVIEEVASDSPASASGLRVGDKVQAVDGISIGDMDEYVGVAQYISDNPNNPISFEVLRGDEIVDVVVTPEDQRGQGKIGVRYDLGLQKERLGPVASLQKSTSLSASVVKQTSQGVGEVATGESSAEDTFTGPIGIASASGAAAKQGIVAVLLLVAVISLSVGLINLVLPIPIMDSGKLYILFAEMILRKDFSAKTQENLAIIGIVMVAIMFAAIIYIDIARIASS